MAKLISGTEIREEVLQEVEDEVKRIREKYGVVPGLVTILVGKEAASVSYVKLKSVTAQRLGFHEVQDNQPDDISEEDLIAVVEKYNKDDSIHGILVQMPLPKHIDQQRVIYAIDPDKDVDGLHPVNAGRLFQGGECVRFHPCTPAGIVHAIRRSGVVIEGSHVVIVNRSILVGKPLAHLLLEKNCNATVTICHTGTKNLSDICKLADILVVAVGHADFVKGDWIKPGACVIDAGTNRVGEKISAKTGKVVAKLSGDVDYDAAVQIAGSITPVPGGVGPLTVAFLMKNCLRSLQYKLNIKRHINE